MVIRPFWIEKIEKLWEKRAIVWLSGVRRVGKTSLTKMMNNSHYINCDLPSVRKRLSDPESFFTSLDKKTVVFDEIHQLNNPSEVLKIAADEYPWIKVLATGSSTLEASRKFRDRLTGRKYSLYLPPVLWTESQGIFNNPSLDHRLLNGGLPEPFLSKEKDNDFFLEWLDSYYARDIQELFPVRNRDGFMKLMEILLRQSGNLMEYSELSKLCGISRPTVMSYIEALRIAHFVFILRPFHGGSSREIVKRPKAYCFDTGFVSFAKGWSRIRDEDRGVLWEHMVLDMIRSEHPENNIFFWQDKSSREIDFIINMPDGEVDIIECKVNPDNLSTTVLSHFRASYPRGKNYCLSPFIKTDYKLRINNLEISFQASI